MILNTGSGDSEYGDIRCDIRRTPKTNLLASTEFLPFQDAAFYLVYCSHVLEHLSQPWVALREIGRVCQTLVILKYPVRKDRVPWMFVHLLNVPITIASTIYYIDYLKTFRTAIHDTFHQLLWRLLGYRTPWAHRWVIRPLGRYYVAEIPLFDTLIRTINKLFHLKIFPPSIGWEFVCTIEVNKTRASK